MKARELSSETGKPVLVLPQPPPATQTGPSDGINKQTCCVRIDVLFPLLCFFHAISSTYLSIYYYSLDLWFAFSPTRVLLAPKRLFQCLKTLAGLCSSHPAVLNGPSLHQVSTGLHKCICQTTVKWSKYSDMSQISSY